MKQSLTYLSFGAALLAASMLGACSSGSGTPSAEDDASVDMGGTGGAGSQGGAANNGGSTSNPCTPKVLYNFNSDLQGFIYSNVVATDPYVNLVAPGTATVASPAPTLQWASEDYDGAAATPGALMIKAMFSDWNQQVAVEVNGPADALNNPIDLTGMALHAKVMLVQGLSPNPSAPGGVVFYIKTGSTYAWGQAPWMNLLSPGTWMDVKFDTAAPDPGSSVDFDPKFPIQMGFQIGSGGGGTVGPFGTTALSTIVYIDQITMLPNTCG